MELSVIVDRDRQDGMVKLLTKRPSYSGEAEDVGIYGTPMKIIEVKNDYIVVYAPANRLHGMFELENVVFQNAIPQMDFVIESENRLWGCRYGEQTSYDGTAKIVNELYASSLGDFKTWETYEGNSMDSYRVSLGVNGKFTGAASYAGKPIFFKEDAMIRVFGNFPANFQVSTSKVEGVQIGMHSTVSITDGVMFYKSPGGIMKYDGSIPTKVSYVFGGDHIDVYDDRIFSGAVLGKYFLVYTDAFDMRNIVLVYDYRSNLWNKWVINSDYPVGGELKEKFEKLGKEIHYTTSHNQIRNLPGDNDFQKYRIAKSTLVVGIRKTLKFDSCFL